eukprot:TRINITY_DN12625_c0_g1_i1.p1 TRINITY_DN12625_c0_g1~~TRINITY_DN12625_c0_g1_i1.p1  ORF type:complete len:275 (-),score=59.11 TRINITY_DN12625_c0_g1_i1:47-871(-)
MARPPNFNQICDNVWVGNRESSYSSNLESAGIDCVLCMVPASPPAHSECLHSSAHLKCGLEDLVDSNIFDLLQPCVDYISECVRAGKQVLIHCEEGKSRSGTIGIAYVMYSQQLSYVDALVQVRKRRGVISPNVGFQTQLQRYQRVLGIRSEKVFLCGDDAQPRADVLAAVRAGDTSVKIVKQVQTNHVFTCASVIAYCPTGSVFSIPDIEFVATVTADRYCSLRTLVRELFDAVPQAQVKSQASRCIEQVIAGLLWASMKVEHPDAWFHHPKL